MRPDALGVIGLGAIGGSLAWQATRAGIPRVVGYSAEPLDGVAALKQGAITDLATSAESLIARCDLVIFAAPPMATLELLAASAVVLRRRGALVTDVTSIKARVMQRVRELGLGPLFAGSHPMCGTHRSGFHGAAPDLFRDALVYVSTSGHVEPEREVVDFWSGVLGAQPVLIDEHDHDALVAWTSHLPQCVASALAVTLARAAPHGVTFGPGARDTTRLAASSSEMWRDVLLLNRDAVLPAIDRLTETLRAARALIEQEDAPRIIEWLDEGARFRRGLEG